MINHRLVVFDQTHADPTALGRRWFMETTVRQLTTALCFSATAHHEWSARLYTVGAAAEGGISSPVVHDLHWNDTLKGQRQLDEDAASEHLRAGNAVQVFVFNGDSDCIRHYLVLPLGEAVHWLETGPRDPRALTRAELIRFVQARRLGVVASIGPDGAPQSAVVGIATSEDFEIVFDTLGTSHKARNLRRDPRASLVVWDGERTAQIEGIADEPTGAELERVRRIYFLSYPDGVERLAWPHITHFRIKPRWTRYSDFLATPQPIIVELSFDNGR
jgi:PPOX class probable F420-dependent enzyme